MSVKVRKAGSFSIGFEVRFLSLNSFNSFWCFFQAAAKASAEFAKENDRLVILGGAMGDKALDADGVKALASLPSLDEQRGIIVGLLNAPATRVAGVLAAPGGQLARVFAAYGTSEDAA